MIRWVPFHILRSVDVLLNYQFLPSFISELMLTLIFSMSQSSAGLKETHIAAESNTGTETKANFQQYYFESFTKFDYPRCSSKAWILSVGKIFLNSCLALCFTLSLAVSNITTTNCSLQIKKSMSQTLFGMKISA